MPNAFPCLPACLPACVPLFRPCLAASLIAASLPFFISRFPAFRFPPPCHAVVGREAARVSSRGSPRSGTPDTAASSSTHREAVQVDRDQTHPHRVAVHFENQPLSGGAAFAAAPGDLPRRLRRPSSPCGNPLLDLAIDPNPAGRHVPLATSPRRFPSSFPAFPLFAFRFFRPCLAASLIAASLLLFISRFPAFPLFAFRFPPPLIGPPSTLPTHQPPPNHQTSCKNFTFYPTSLFR